MLKIRIAVAVLTFAVALNPAIAAEPNPLGSIWRQGVTNTTTWIIGTLRSTADLDQLQAQETHPEVHSDQQKPLQDSYFRFEAQCSDDDFTVRVKADASEQEPPQMKSETPYAFEDSPLREASVTVNGESSLNLHYLWGSINGVSTHADDRLNLAGSVYRFLTQIEMRPETAIRLSTPKGSASYLLDTSYQATTNNEAINAFKRQCAEAVKNWH